MRGKDGTKSQYGSKDGKSAAYAIATQQAHALKKSPKGFKTAKGVRAAKRKYDDPKDMKKTASLGVAWTLLLEKVAAKVLAYGPKAFAEHAARKAKLREMNLAVDRLRRRVPQRVTQ